jgi:hypothetical protein
MKQKTKNPTRAGIGRAFSAIYKGVIHPFSKASNMAAESQRMDQKDSPKIKKTVKPEIYWPHFQI